MGSSYLILRLWRVRGSRARSCQPPPGSSRASQRSVSFALSELYVGTAVVVFVTIRLGRLSERIKKDEEEEGSAST